MPDAESKAPPVQVCEVSISGEELGLGSNPLAASGVEPLGSYVTNFIHRIDREGAPPLVLKGLESSVPWNDG